MSLRSLDRSLRQLRPQRAQDQQGGHGLQHLPLSDTLVRCRVQDANTEERGVAGRQEGTFTHYLWFHRRQDVLRGDRFEFDDGTFLEVVTVWTEDVPGGFKKCRAWLRQKGQ